MTAALWRPRRIRGSGQLVPRGGRSRSAGIARGESDERDEDSNSRNAAIMHRDAVRARVLRISPGHIG